MLQNAFNPIIALRKAKIVYNFGLSECSRVKCLSKEPGRRYHSSINSCALMRYNKKKRNKFNEN